MGREKFSKVWEAVLRYPPLKERMQEKSPDIYHKVKQNIKEIASTHDVRFVRIVEEVFDRAIPFFYSHLKVGSIHGPYLNQLKQSETLIFVPNHQSHLDYLFLSYVLFKSHRFVPFIAGGINLNIFPIGPLFRRAGCFFIRRSFQNDILYKLSLEAYLFYLLENNIPIEFFFEGGRSRSGRLRPVKFGLFQMLVTAHSYLPEHSRRPLRFVPVSLQHETLVEQQSLLKELQGQKKKKENPFQLIKTATILLKQLGPVHLFLGESFSFSGLTQLQLNLQETEKEERKKIVHSLAIKCYQEVSNNLLITPQAFLSLVFLDFEEKKGFLLEEILNRWKQFSYLINLQESKKLAESLKSFDQAQETLKSSLKFLLDNKNILVVKENGKIFYGISKARRKYFAYYKNTILHHLLPFWMILTIWNSFQKGQSFSLKTINEVYNLHFSLLKFDFFFPEKKHQISIALSYFSVLLEKKVSSLKMFMEICEKMPQEELEEVNKKVQEQLKIVKTSFQGLYVFLYYCFKYFMLNSVEESYSHFLSLPEIVEISDENFSLESYTHAQKSFQSFSQEERSGIFVFLESYVH